MAEFSKKKKNSEKSTHSNEVRWPLLRASKFLLGLYFDQKGKIGKNDFNPINIHVAHNLNQKKPLSPKTGPATWIFINYS